MFDARPGLATFALLATACASSNPPEVRAADEHVLWDPATAGPREGGAHANPTRYSPTDYSALPILPEYPCEEDESLLDAGTTGTLDPKALAKGVESLQLQRSACFDLGVRDNPNLRGTVTVRLVVESDGHVARAEPVCTSMTDTKVVACIVDVFKHHQFEHPVRGKVTVVYPSLFANGDLALHPRSQPDATALATSDTVPDAGRGHQVETAAARPGSVDLFGQPFLKQYPCHPPEPLSDAVWSDLRLNRQFHPDGGPLDQPSGRLDPALIQQVVRAAYYKMRSCYEAGVARRADLGGRVMARFVIGPDGRVAAVKPICTTMPDRAVVACVVDEYKKLQFPAPEGGNVSVVYPIMFSPAY